MNMSKVFLGGPISNAIRDKVFDEKIKRKILAIYEKLKSEGHNISSAHISENFGKKAPKIKKMFKTDKKWISKAKRAVFFLSYDEEKDCLLRTDGSYIEIGICYEKNIPITIISNAPKKKLPTMLRSMKIYNSDKVKFIAFDRFLAAETIFPDFNGVNKTRRRN